MVMKIKAERNKYGDVGWKSDQKMFAKVTVTWKQWLGDAGEHLYAAQLLLPHIQAYDALLKELTDIKVSSAKVPPSMTGIYFFHCAVSIENSMKGVIASKNRTVVKKVTLEKARIPRILTGHDLVKLAGRAVYTMGIDEEYVLAFLTRYGTWAGKYPLPLNNEDNAVNGRLSDGKHYLTGGWRPDEVPHFLTFSADIYKWARAEAEKYSDSSGSSKDLA
jgi:hypothetical protein